MTIEEKARRYDEALKNARDVYTYYCDDREQLRKIESIFPELTESEDERIRKALVHTFEYYSSAMNSPYLSGIYRKDILAWLEKQGEQKPIMDIPKFKVGQWIVWQDKCYKVNYNGCGYELVDQNGLSTSLEYGTIDENAHIWDIIKDAKDGDVLASKKTLCVLIFKGIDTSTRFCSYYNTIRYSNAGWSNDKFLPATKEERELLFSKMRENGYKWDVDNKQLIKI